MHISNTLLTYALIATGAASIVRRQDGDDTADSSSGGDGGCMVACEAAANEAVEGHCNNSTWTDYLDGCLQCANTAGFWADYETEVRSNAGDCGLTAEPQPSAIEDGDDSDDGLPGTSPDTGADADMDDSSPDTGADADMDDSSPDSVPDTGADADMDDSSPDTAPDTGADADMDDSSPDSTAGPTGSTASPTSDTATETSAPADSGAGAPHTPFVASALVGIVAALFAYAM